MTDPDEAAISGVLRELSDLVGFAAALELSNRWGGRALYIPTPERLPDDHPIVQTIGRRRALLLCEVYRGGTAHIPLAADVHKARRNRRIRHDYRQGMHPNEIALNHGLTPRQVRNIVAGEF